MAETVGQGQAGGLSRCSAAATPAGATPAPPRWRRSAAALAIVAASDLLPVVPASYLGAIEARPAAIRAGVRSFPLPVATDAITVSEIWHPRMDADLAHRWLRGVVLETCREVGQPRNLPAPRPR